MQALGRHLQGLKENRERGTRDIILLQETHLNEGEHSSAEKQYAALWGYKRAVAPTLSFWSSGKQRSAGVAILVNPYGAIKNVQPWQKENWSKNAVMVTGDIGTESFLFINLYAPSKGDARIAFYNQLKSLKLPDNVKVVCGGDFNCVTETRIDRYNSNSKGDKGAKELQQFIEGNGLTDTGFRNIPTKYNKNDRREYAQHFHTYKHTSASGKVSTSRIDRIYVNAAAGKLVRGVTTEESPCHTDHRGVLLEMHPPSGPVRIKKRPRIYPPPPFAQAASQSMIEERLQQLQIKLSKTTECQAVMEWDTFKTELTKEMGDFHKMTRQKMTNGFRTRIRRLKKKLENCDYTGGKGSGDERESVLAEIRRLQENRRSVRMKVIINRNAWSSRASTKHFFRRICTKFGDNVIPTLRSKISDSKWGPHEKAEILAENWEPIFNGEAEERENLDQYLDRIKVNWETPDMTDIDDEFTEEEVITAIKRCKRGKACGPDDLPNDWYQDHCTQIAPLLTGIFNSCMKNGITPKTFVDAYIFSISKGGDTADPLNYRPIALLNTDYKIFTRVLAWRVRNYISRLVHRTQFGFVPGRTIHEAIDLFEAAKRICREKQECSDAQVLMLDFAKAYDSLDRDFLLKVLKAKGFPPKFCAVVGAIHKGTRVQFMANGMLSKPLGVTSGIRQGCPLAPLLFIIAADILYDEIETDPRLEGIVLTDEVDELKLQVAGYADDTAIYLKSKFMQTQAIAAVDRFSKVSGLRLNVKKSAAITLGRTEPQCEGEVGSTQNSTAMRVPETETTRYLGHIAGVSTTTDEAWKRAFAALTIRLTLATGKTNTAQQRAMIASVIIVPKLLYVARHAWPTEAHIKQADKRIRNFVWKSSFAEPDKAPTGWISAVQAEQPTKEGGIGLPNIRAELVAMGSMTAGTWALTEHKVIQITGDVLQTCTGNQKKKLTPVNRVPQKKIGADLWRTGLPWAQYMFAQQQQSKEEQADESRKLRIALRYSNGLTTRWCNAGLKCELRDTAMLNVAIIRRARNESRGDFIHDSFGNLRLQEVKLWDATGLRGHWNQYTHLIHGIQGKNIEDIVRVTWMETGVIILTPVQQQLPMPSKMAHEFRELCLNLIATWPELVFKPTSHGYMKVHHGLEDPHHVFEVDSDSGDVIHSWGAMKRSVHREKEDMTTEQAIAQDLGVPNHSVWITPHPAIQRMKPLWEGRRRWSQTRKQYRALYLRNRRADAQRRAESRQQQWAGQHAEIAEALGRLTWKTLQTMEGVPAYQLQNLHRLKHDRLRLWNKETKDYGCVSCGERRTAGTAHLVWEFEVAKRFWTTMMNLWKPRDSNTTTTPNHRRMALADIFSMKVRTLPSWLVEWGRTQDDETWDLAQSITQDIWVICCAETVSAIWIWNVNKMFPDGRSPKSAKEAADQHVHTLKNAINRYRIGLYPLTQRSKIKMDILEVLTGRNGRIVAQAEQAAEVERLGFFDGGSRGNPGPGGGGSVIVELGVNPERDKVLWAAATALGQPSITNNVAEFVGLHRLLTKAVEAKWHSIHVIGDSAMIIRMMQERKMPKHKQMQHWFRITRKLADRCKVASWQHHYRKNNKAADWLANTAMDNRASCMVMTTEVRADHYIRKGVEERIQEDVQRWREERGPAEELSPG